MIWTENPGWDSCGQRYLLAKQRDRTQGWAPTREQKEIPMLSPAFTSARLTKISSPMSILVPTQYVLTSAQRIASKSSGSGGTTLIRRHRH